MYLEILCTGLVMLAIHYRAAAREETAKEAPVSHRIAAMIRGVHLNRWGQAPLQPVRPSPLVGYLP